MRDEARDNSASRPAGGLRTARGEEMRARLLSAAAEAFAERGYAATRVQDITKLAECSHGNFYWHFSDKDDVLIAVLRPALTEVFRASKSHRGSGRDGLEAFTANIESYLTAYAAHRGLLTVIREAAAQRGSSRFFSMWMEERARFIDRTSTWLGKFGQLAPGVDPKTAAELLGAMVEQIAYTRIGCAADEPTADTISHLARQAALIWHRGTFG